MDYIFAIFFGILGFGVVYFLSAKHEGGKGILPSMKFQIRGYTFHFHHWFVFFIMLVVLLVMNIYTIFLLAFIIGIIVQGLTYKDRFLFVYRSRDKESIYEKYKTKNNRDSGTNSDWKE